MMLEQQSETLRWRIEAFKEHNRNVDLRTLVSEARPYIELLQYHPLFCVGARQWLQRANEQLEEEKPR